MKTPNLKQKLKTRLKIIRNYLSEKLATKELIRLRCPEVNLTELLLHPNVSSEPQKMCEKHVLITKHELIWILDNIHSNQVLIEKLKKRSKFRTDVIEVNKENEFLKFDNGFLREKSQDMKGEIDDLKSEVENLKEDKEELARTVNALRVLLKERNKKFDQLVLEYETKICENQLRHSSVVDMISRGMEVHLNS